MTFDKMFLDVAAVVAQKSKSTRLKVGAVLVRDNRILSTGYNGLVSGTVPDVLEDEDGVTKKEVIHAELNCIISCARNGVSCDNSILYLTHSPCQACAALIAQAGIRKVIYMDDYREVDGVLALKGRGIEVVKYGQEEMVENIVRLYELEAIDRDGVDGGFWGQVNNESVKIFGTEKSGLLQVFHIENLDGRFFRDVLTELGFTIKDELESGTYFNDSYCLRSIGDGSKKKFKRKYAEKAKQYFGWDIVYDNHNKPIGNKLADGSINYWK